MRNLASLLIAAHAPFAFAAGKPNVLFIAADVLQLMRKRASGFLNLPH